jgi:hypothetical protein
MMVAARKIDARQLTNCDHCGAESKYGCGNRLRMLNRRIDDGIARYDIKLGDA